MRKNKHLLIMIALLLGIIFGCDNQSKKLEANKDIVRRFGEAVNNNDYEALDNVVASNFIRHSQATPEVNIRSLEEFKQFVKASSVTFPDMKGIIDIIVAEKDLVAVYTTFTGTQKGPMGPFPASGNKMVSMTMAIFRLENGKIAELWIEWDNLAILTQLGLFPPPPPPQ
jgi:steroid delta-isomerase-like uncharacterized protein